MTSTSTYRCAWCGSDPLSIAYHDEEWGVPVTDDRKLFEFLILEGAQAGLSWTTILKKRDGYRVAFHDFDVSSVAAMDASDEERLRSRDGIVRNRLKISSAITNARAFLRIQHSHGSFCRYLWDFVDGIPLDGKRRSLGEIPAQTELSRRISGDLKNRGFRFVGPTIMYAYLQAVGVVNDHEIGCFRYTAIRSKNATVLCG